jgi:NtrC-family two-component system response regulator AlgB
MNTSHLTPEVPLDATSQAMRSIVQQIPAIASHHVPVLLRGESGAGKSVLGRALHAASFRRAQRFITVDCRAFEQDAAAAAQILAQKLAEAARGTILLEEVSALPDRLQAIVALRLEEQCLAPPSAAYPRIIATSYRDLEAAVRADRFRKELLSRLSVIEIRVPPLRDRPEDILPLASRFAETFALEARQTTRQLTSRSKRALLAYAWPGNIRELRNAMQRALIVGEGPALDVDALPPKIGAALLMD